MQNSWLLRMTALAALASSALAPHAAHAFCGFFVSSAGGKLFSDATTVVLMRAGTRTVLSMQNNYRGPPEDFALVVPVPVVLQKGQVRTLPSAVFERIDALASPRLVEYELPGHCPPIGREDFRTPVTSRHLVRRHVRDK